MAKICELPRDLKQVDLFLDGVFDRTDVAEVKPDMSAWIDGDSLAETSSKWSDLVVTLMPMNR